jgi:hypothetical protein
MGKPTFSTSLGIFFFEGLTAMFPVYIEIQKQCKKSEHRLVKETEKKKIA